MDVRALPLQIRRHAAFLHGPLGKRNGAGATDLEELRFLEPGLEVLRGQLLLLRMKRDQARKVDGGLIGVAKRWRLSLDTRIETESVSRRDGQIARRPD